MDAVQNVFLRLGIDDRPLHDNATEGRLDVSAGATEPVVQVHVAEGGIEIVLKQTVDHAAADPDAFRIAGRAGHLFGHFRKIVQALRVLPGLFGGLLLRLVGLFVLGQGRRGAEVQGKAESWRDNQKAEHDGWILWRVGATLVLRPAVYIGFRPQCGLEPTAGDFRLSRLLSSLHVTPHRGDIWRAPVFVRKGGPRSRTSTDDDS